jgi:Domain of unknown function (DUF4383)
MAEAPLVRALGSRAEHHHDGGRTPAQVYCLLAGAALLLAGAVGWIADASFDTGTDVDGSNLLIFEVNGWHNLVHLASGALLLACAPRRTSARTVALLFGITYGAVAVYGLIAGDNVIGLMPVNGPDHVLHLALAAAGVLAALASPAGEPLHATTAPATRGTPVSDPQAAGRPDEVDPMTGAPKDRERPTR